MQIIKSIQRIFLFIFLFSINFEVWDPFNSGGNFSIAKLTAILYFISIIPNTRQFFRLDRIISIIYPIFVFFILLTIMSILNANEKFPGFFNNTIFLNLLLFLFLLNHARQDFLILEKGLIFFAIGSVLLVTLFFLGVGVSYVGGRLSMFGDNQNGLGIKVAISSIIIVYNVIQNNLKLNNYRFILLFFVPFMLIFIGETGSRVATISFVLAFLTGIGLFKTKTFFNKIIIILGGLFLMVLLGFFLLQSDTLRARLQDTKNEGDLGSRDIIWKNIFPIIKENPILGIGQTGYDFEVSLIYGEPESPHNVILEVLCYTGIVGLFFYLLFLYKIGLISYQSYQRDVGLLPMLLFIPIMGILLSGQLLDNKVGWMIFAYIIGSSAIKINKHA